jgi:uncharacterized membrane protein
MYIINIYEQNINQFVGLYIFVAVTPWIWHRMPNNVGVLFVCVCVCVCVCVWVWVLYCITKYICWKIFWLGLICGFYYRLILKVHEVRTTLASLLCFLVIKMRSAVSQTE